MTKAKKPWHREPYFLKFLSLTFPWLLPQFPQWGENMATYSPAAAGTVGVRSQSCGYSALKPPWQYSCSLGDRPAAARGPAMSVTERVSLLLSSHFPQLPPCPARDRKTKVSYPQCCTLCLTPQDAAFPKSGDPIGHGTNLLSLITTQMSSSPINLPRFNTGQA